MIQAIIFDLDGTLVQTEKLKALSYAKAVQQLRNLPAPDADAIEAYREIVGAGGDKQSRHVMVKLGLEDELSPLMNKYQVTEPEQVLTIIRMSLYHKMVADPRVIKSNQWPYTVKLLKAVRDAGCLTALATMSKHGEVTHVLDSLGITSMLDLILTDEDIQNPKPDPEIYLLALKKLKLPPKECLALEDSVNGVKAALAAGVNVIAIATPFTNAALHTSQIIEDVWIVHEPENVCEVVQQRIKMHGLEAH